MSADVEHLTCKQLVDLLTDYLEGAVDAQQRADIERHIVFCRGCANYVEQMRGTIDLLARIAADEPEDAPADDLLAVFRDWRDDRATAAPGDAS
jgi:anti-sigma factor RsiW